MREPQYYICIERLDTEEKAFLGVVRGPIAALVEGAILENVRAGRGQASFRPSGTEGASPCLRC